MTAETRSSPGSKPGIILIDEEKLSLAPETASLRVQTPSKVHVEKSKLNCLTQSLSRARELSCFQSSGLHHLETSTAEFPWKCSPATSTTEEGCQILTNSKAKASMSSLMLGYSVETVALNGQFLLLPAKLLNLYVVQ